MPQADYQGAERVGHTAFGPVSQTVAPSAHKDVSIMKVIMMQGLVCRGGQSSTEIGKIQASAYKAVRIPRSLAPRFAQCAAWLGHLTRLRIELATELDADPAPPKANSSAYVALAKFNLNLYLARAFNNFRHFGAQIQSKKPHSRYACT